MESKQKEVKTEGNESLALVVNIGNSSRDVVDLECLVNSSVPCSVVSRPVWAASKFMAEFKEMCDSIKNPVVDKSNPPVCVLIYMGPSNSTGALLLNGVQETVSPVSVLKCWEASKAKTNGAVLVMFILSEYGQVWIDSAEVRNDPSNPSVIIQVSNNSESFLRQWMHYTKGNIHARQLRNPFGPTLGFFQGRRVIAIPAHPCIVSKLFDLTNRVSANHSLPLKFNSVPNHLPSSFHLCVLYSGREDAPEEVVSGESAYQYFKYTGGFGPYISDPNGVDEKKGQLGIDTLFSSTEYKTCVLVYCGRSFKHHKDGVFDSHSILPDNLFPRWLNSKAYANGGTLFFLNQTSHSGKWVEDAMTLQNKVQKPLQMCIQASTNAQETDISSGIFFPLWAKYMVRLITEQQLLIQLPNSPCAYVEAPKAQIVRIVRVLAQEGLSTLFNATYVPVVPIAKIELVASELKRAATILRERARADPPHNSIAAHAFDPLCSNLQNALKSLQNIPLDPFIPGDSKVLCKSADCATVNKLGMEFNMGIKPEMSLYHFLPFHYSGPAAYCDQCQQKIADISAGFWHCQTCHNYDLCKQCAVRATQS
jgi:hypothetical protein